MKGQYHGRHADNKIVIRKYYEHQGNLMHINLTTEMDAFIENHKLSQFTQYEIDI